MESTDKNPPVFGTSIKWTTTTAVLSSLCVGFFDLLRAIFGSSAPISGADLVGLGAGIIGFYLAVGLGIGVGEGILLSGWADFRTRVLKQLPVSRSIMSDSGTDAGWAAGLLSASLCIALMAAMVFLLHSKFSSHFANRHLSAIFLSGAAVCGALVVCAAFFPLHTLLRRLLFRVPHLRAVPRTSLVAAGLIVCSSAVVGFMATRSAWRMINFGPYLALALFFSLQAAWSVMLDRRTRRFRRRAVAWLVPAFSGGVATAGLVLSASSFDRSQAVRMAASDGTWVGSTFLRVGR